MRSIRELVQLSSEYLSKRGIKNSRREAEELLSALLKRPRLELYFDYDAPIEEQEIAQYRDWIRRKGEKEPLAYIIGHVEFLDCTLSVSPGVLIPRQETEILATRVLKEVSSDQKNLWDLCSGSGCLGLSLKKKRPDLNVVLSDFSEKALDYARKNALANQLDVELLHGDLLQPFKGRKAEVVICNPPYVTEEEYSTLEDEVRLYEPKEALIGGLSFYKRFAEELPTYLLNGAKIFFEIGSSQAKEVEGIFSEKHWKRKCCEKDWSGHDRFFFLEYEENF